jgi:hypothetical protein
MAPQHIDDLPRHEEPRQLMLGLIDELPQEGSVIRQLMMWGSLGLAVVLFVVLVWVTAPNAPLGTTSRPRPSLSNAAQIEQTAPLKLSEAARRIAANIAKLPELLLK